jgi:geranylgeranyl pyrophosphate synthase
MIGKKTASLFSSACGLGGIGANASRREIAALKKYGWNLGIAFQIADDILDLYGKQQFGKPLGQDIRERKLGNILVLFALGELSLKERKTVKEIFRKDSIKESDVKRVIAYIKKTGAKERALSFAQSYVRKAKKSLNPLHAGRYRNALGEFAEFALKREK